MQTLLVTKHDLIHLILHLKKEREREMFSQLGHSNDFQQKKGGINELIIISLCLLPETFSQICCKKTHFTLEYNR